MKNKIEEIAVKVENGDVNYEDVTYLINQARKANTASLLIHRIAAISTNSPDNQHSIRESLNTVKDLTRNFVDK